MWVNCFLQIALGLASHTKDLETIRAILNETLSLGLANQMAPDGSFPYEARAGWFTSS